MVLIGVVRRSLTLEEYGDVASLEVIKEVGYGLFKTIGFNVLFVGNREAIFVKMLARFLDQDDLWQLCLPVFRIPHPTLISHLSLYALLHRIDGKPVSVTKFVAGLLEGRYQELI